MAWLVERWLQYMDEFSDLEHWFGLKAGPDLVNRYDVAIAALESENVDEWMADAANFAVSDAAAQHFRERWLEGAQFPTVEPGQVFSQMRNGFLTAMRKARIRELPMSVMWVTLDTAEPGFFEVAHVIGANAVTVVIASPRPQAESQG